MQRRLVIKPVRRGSLGGWSTTIVARVWLNVLRSRSARREEPLDGHLPDPVVSVERTRQPEDEAVLADSVGLALLVVLDTLTPAERLAFVRTAGVTLRKCFRRPEAGIKHQTSQAPPLLNEPASP
jgi:DNA-directed RNA polymerase specialized sigma24 family protein